MLWKNVNSKKSALKFIFFNETCYYVENQVFGVATSWDMLLNETCFYLRLYGILLFKSVPNFFGPLQCQFKKQNEFFDYWSIIVKNIIDKHFYLKKVPKFDG